jgi:BlaI family penicillinase repressor
MADLERRLSAAQYEVLQAIWEIGPPGGTTLQIWKIIVKKRSIVRNTVLKVVERLEKRGWLRREAELADGFHYWPTKTREEVEAMLSGDFVESFFEGSASQLVLSLLGQKQVGSEELARLKQLLAEAEAAESAKKRTSAKKRRS